MQTFLPFESYEKSAKVLDRQRLGKQRVEALQIMKAIADPSYSWQNHPAVNQWREAPGSLFLYCVTVCVEWTDRGYKDKVKQQAFDLYHANSCFHLISVPRWLGDRKFHRSHMSNLVRKDPEHYLPHFNGVPDDLEYFWPSKSDEYPEVIIVNNKRTEHQKFHHAPGNPNVYTNRDFLGNGDAFV